MTELILFTDVRLVFSRAKFHDLKCTLESPMELLKILSHLSEMRIQLIWSRARMPVFLMLLRF